MDLLIAEDLLLLLLDDETGSRGSSLAPDAVIGGALLTELAADGLLQLAPSSSRWRSEDDVVAVPGAAATDPVLQDALTIVVEKPRAAKELVGPVGKGVADVLLERLAQRGILQRQDDKVLGLFPRTRWPAADSSHEEHVRRRIDAALTGGESPGARIAALIALLDGADQLGVLAVDGMSNRQIKARAKEIAEGDWAGEAVGKAVQDVMNVILMTAVMTPIITSTATN